MAKPAAEVVVMGPFRSKRSGLWNTAGLLGLTMLVVACNGGTGTPDLAPILAAVDDRQTTLGEPITLTVAVSDEVPATVDVSAVSSNQDVVPATGLELSGSGGWRTLTITPSSAVPGSTTITVTATDEGDRSTSQVFGVEVTRPFSDKPEYLSPANADVVGSSVAIDDGVAVAGGQEYAYVFELDGDTWVERQKLTSLQNGFNAVQAFGDSVAVDGTRVLVGASETDGTATDQGVAFLFQGSSGVYTFAEELLDNAPGEDDRLGRAVGVSGDYLFTGAPGAEENDVRSGSVVVFTPEGQGDWTVLGKLTPSDAAVGSVFGEALDVSGGLLVVGDYARDAQSGEAYVFEEDAGFWNETGKLGPDDLEAGDQFGIAVAADDDWVLVGAWNDDSMGPNAGAVYVYTRDGSGWQQVDKLFASDAAEQASFGGSVALDYPYAVVGNYLEDSQGTNAGAVYVFRHDGTAWHEVAKLVSPQPAEGAGFGWDVDISGENLIVSQVQDPRFTAVYRR